MTEHDPIEALVEALLKPVREVGKLLAEAIDAIDTDLRELRQHVDGLLRRVGELEGRVNE